jgi:acetyl esterase/lipase
MPWTRFTYPNADMTLSCSGLMREAGGDVTYVPHPGLVHGFLGLGDISAAARLAGDGLFRRYGAIVRRPARAGAAQVPEPPAIS